VNRRDIILAGLTAGLLSLPKVVLASDEPFLISEAEISQVPKKFRRRKVSISLDYPPRHHRHRYGEQVPLPRSRGWPSCTLRHRRGPAGFRVGRDGRNPPQGQVANLDSARGHGGARRVCGEVGGRHARRTHQSAWGTGPLSLQGQSRHAVPHSRHDGAVLHRKSGIVRLHPDAERRCCRPL